MNNCLKEIEHEIKYLHTESFNLIIVVKGVLRTRDVFPEVKEINLPF